MRQFSENAHNELANKICLECNREFTGLVAACPHDNSLLVPAAQDPLIGTKLSGKYEILSVLGTGGMGVVYKGRQDLMDRIVAIKMLQAHFLADSANVKRFQQEGKATCKLNHPHIITIFDFGISKQTGQPFIVMDYLQGIALSDVLKQEGKVSVDRALKIFIQACEALGYAHKQGVVHRDLKPSNIVLTNYDGEKDFVKVVDFGVALLMEDESGEGRQRLTQLGEVCGSPVYMSPEQCQGYKVDNRSDIYSMGIVMYETLTNRLPLLGKTMVETMRKHIEDSPQPFAESRPDLYIPERLESVIMKAMAKAPEDRYQSMEQLAADLRLAIPKPSRSQALRTAPLKIEDDTSSTKIDLRDLLMKMTVTHWIIAIVAILLSMLITLAAVWLIASSTKDKKSSRNQIEMTPVVETTKVAPTNKYTEQKSPSGSADTGDLQGTEAKVETDIEKAPPAKSSPAKPFEKPSEKTSSTVSKKSNQRKASNSSKKQSTQTSSTEQGSKPKTQSTKSGEDVWHDLMRMRKYNQN